MSRRSYLGAAFLARLCEALMERNKGIDAKRVEAVGRGWEEPAGSDSNLNRRVEVQWFTLE